MNLNLLKKIAQRNLKRQTFLLKQKRESFILKLKTIRKLYYNLLANQDPAIKIAAIVESVSQCFLPNIDMSTLQLPKESCAGYMRKEEMATIAIVHKANALGPKIAAGEGFQLNSDGTTKNQVKLNSVALNVLVLSVNEITDGTSITIIDDIDKD